MHQITLADATQRLAPAELLCPLVVSGQNVRERMHWSSQRKEVRAWTAWLHYERARLGVARALRSRIVAITSYRRRRFHDHANLVGGCKGLVDGLVASGWLVDDSIALMTATYAQGLGSQSPTGKPCTLIRIEDAA